MFLLAVADVIAIPKIEALLIVPIFVLFVEKLRNKLFLTNVKVPIELIPTI